MASAIDATKPADSSAALTSDLRANLLAAKTEIEALQAGKQDTLVSGTSIKTINGSSLIGSGDLVVGGGSGTVTSVSVTTANGVSGSVATATTTPAISLTLGAITPSSVAASGTVTGSNLSGTNTGDETGARVAALLHAASNKTTLVDADEVNGTDSAASFGLIRTTWTNVKAFLKTYFDTLYAPKGLATASGLTMSTNKLLGRNTATTGAIEEITLGTNLSMTGTTLNAAGGGGSGTVTATAGSLTSNAVVLGAGTTDTKVSTGITTDGVGAVTLTPAANTSALTVASHTHTTSNPAISVAQTWNAGAATFTGWKLNITNTASAAASLLMDLQVGATSKFAVRKDGLITGGGGTGSASINLGTAGANDTYIGVGDTRVGHRTTTNGWFVGANMHFGWTSSNINAAGTIDTCLYRKAAKIIEINNGTAGSYNATAFSTGSQTVANLPAAATAGAGARSFVTNATATTFLSTVAGGGANKVPVVSDGTNWLIG